MLAANSVGMVLLLLAGAAAAQQHEAVVSVSGLSYRVQALSSSLIRLEAEAPNGGFENRSTFFAQNRSWPGVALTVTAAGLNSTTLSTAGWSLELTAGGTPNAGAALSALGGGSTCGNAIAGGVSAGTKLAAAAPAAATAAPTSCCAACDVAAGCAAWVWTPAVPAAPPSPPHGGGGGKGPLRAAPCDAEREGQQWKLSRKRGDNGWTSVESANGHNGCWEITGCDRTEGAHLGTSYGCKNVPAPGYGNDCAANGAWVAQKNGTLTSVMDGHCLTLGADKKSLEVDTCVAGDKSQQWVFDEKWTHPGSVSTQANPHHSLVPRDVSERLLVIAGHAVECALRCRLRQRRDRHLHRQWPDY